MLPLDRIATANPCLGDYQACPLFQEVDGGARGRARRAAGAGARIRQKGWIAMILAFPLSILGLVAVAISLVIAHRHGVAR